MVANGTSKYLTDSYPSRSGNLKTKIVGKYNHK